MLYKKKSGCKFFKRAIHVVLITLFAVNILHAQQIDILLKGGHVIDPKNTLDEQMDVAIAVLSFNALANSSCVST